MHQYHEVVLRLLVGGVFRTVARWPHSREACDTAAWAAKLFGGQAVLTTTKEWEF